MSYTHKPSSSSARILRCNHLILKNKAAVLEQPQDLCLKNGWVAKILKTTSSLQIMLVESMQTA